MSHRHQLSSTPVDTPTGIEPECGKFATQFSLQRATENVTARYSISNMLHVQRYADLIHRRRLRRERVFRDRAHRLDVYNGVDFRWQYRLQQATVMDIIDVIKACRDDIQPGHNGRNQDLTATLKDSTGTVLLHYNQFPEGIWKSALHEYVGPP